MDPTPEPVLKNAVATGIALQILGVAAALTSYYGWWTPSGEELLLWASAFGVLVGLVLYVQGWLVRKRVTPNAKVALTTTDVALLEAANDPQTPRGMGILRDIAQIERDRVPPLQGKAG